MNSEAFLQNKKRKEKYSNSKNFVSRTLSQISSCKLYKNLQHYLFYPFLSRFFYKKIPF